MLNYQYDLQPCEGSLKKVRAWAIFSLALVLAANAAPAQERTGAVTDHVIVISVDGLRPDAIDRFGAKTIQRLATEGAHSYTAQTILPSKTLPSHTSMLTGVTPEVHGIFWNDDRTREVGMVAVPTIFVEAKRAGFTTAAFFSKSKLRHLLVDGSLDYSQAPRGLDTWMATQTIGDAITYLRHRRPNLLFVHIGEPDYAGHTVGWMSYPYGAAVRRADGAVSALLRQAEKSFGSGNYTVVLTADHGGHARDHGADTPVERTIPWIVWGRGVSAGAQPTSVRTTDTAATVLWLLGVRPPISWSGTAVASAFTSAAQLAASAAIDGLTKASR
jgi:predicted AlkP superfamily pyrophosphatase or phosphodiesterase